MTGTCDHRDSAGNLHAALDRALADRASSGARGGLTARRLAAGEGWSVRDVICTAGPRDRSGEERHGRVSIAVVVAGTFEYRSTNGRALMTPGALMLGEPGESYECAHPHGHGDRCLSFHYARDWFARLAADAGGRRTGFGVPYVPAVRPLTAVVARGCAGLLGAPAMAWEELAIEIAARTAVLTADRPRPAQASPGAERRVMQAVRRIERDLDDPLTLADLAREARLSPFHFLRTFRQITGVTPHQYIRRIRIRQAALRVLSSREPILTIALECGFCDVSNFNRAFRQELGVTPGELRRTHGSSRSRPLALTTYRARR